LSHAQEPPSFVPLVPRMQPLGLVCGFRWQRLQGAQCGGMRHGDRRVGLQQRAVVFEERLLGRRAPAGEQLPRVRSDRSALTRGQIIRVSDRVIDSRDQPLLRL
jgi:hypothetical protein